MLLYLSPSRPLARSLPLFSCDACVWPCATLCARRYLNDPAMIHAIAHPVQAPVLLVLTPVKFMMRGSSVPHGHALRRPWRPIVCDPVRCG